MERNSGVSVAALVIILCASKFICGHAQDPTTQLVPAIITFGDSVVDVGNNDYLHSTIFKADFPPYGRDFKNHQPTGRFCNGKLATDIIGKNLLIGANFASAASGYYDQTAIMYHAIPLSQQLEYYKEYQSKLKKVAGNSKATSILSEALYLIGFGSGDFIQNYYINPHLNKIYSPNDFSSKLVQIFTNFIQDLYGLGARRIGVTSLPPLGCLPASIKLFGSGRSNGCVSSFNTDAQGFNKKLNASTASLAKKYYPKLKIVMFDIYKPLYDLSTNPSAHGFLEARRGCCGTATVGTTSVLWSPKSVRTCANATGYVFWDGVHPSESANEVITESLLFQGIPLIG